MNRADMNPANPLTYASLADEIADPPLACYHINQRLAYLSDKDELTPDEERELEWLGTIADYESDEPEWIMTIEGGPESINANLYHDLYREPDLYRESR